MSSKIVRTLARLTAAALLGCVAVAARAGSFAEAALTPDAAAARAQAEALLSQRYATLWATLPAAERAAFSARERQWLNVGRWQEKDACVAARAETSGAACLTEVTLRHALALPEARVAQIVVSR
jgi:hypothetical protein